jgi:hypothetical protein
VNPGEGSPTSLRLPAARRPPPADPPHPRFFPVKADLPLVRVYNPASRYRPRELTFRYWGPVARFDHHQFPVEDPNHDPDRGIWYSCHEDLACAIVEVCTTLGVVEIDVWRIARPSVQRDLQLLDLRAAGASAAGCDPSIATNPSRGWTCEWSRYFYEDSAFDGIDGLLYEGQFSHGNCVALYERAEGALLCDDCGVPAMALVDQVIEIADRHGLEVILPVT